MPKLNGSFWLAIIAVMFISAGISVMYLSAESGLYWSDYNYYQFILKTVRDAFVENPLTGSALIVYSTKLLYNFLFTIPLLPTALIFGDSRYAFIIGQVLLFQIPAALILAVLVNKTLKSPSNKMFWISFAIFMTQPTLWACSLRGYPDAIALICLLLSYYYCQKMQDNPTLKNTLATGIFLALAPFLRRHYAYGAIAVATSFFAVLNKEKKDFKHTLLQLAKIGLVSILFLSTIGIGFVSSIFSEPFLNLYQTACVFDPTVIAGYFISGFGLFTWLLAMAGCYLAFKSDLFDKKQLNNLTALGILMVLDWMVFGKHLAVHYLLYAAPIVVLGCSAFFFVLTSSKKLLVAVFAPLMLMNFAIGILPYKTFPEGLTRYGMLTVPLNEGSIIGRMVSANFGPLTRNDQMQMGLLLKEITGMGRAFQPVFIVSGNHILCPDILRNYQRKNELNDDFPKYIEPPILNSRDAIPLGALLTCNSAVMVHPFKPMYKPEHSTILSCVLDCFDKKWAMSEDFEKLPFTANLDDDSQVTIFKRTRLTSIATAVKTLVAMKKSIEPDPIFGQPLWISSTQAYEPTGKEYQATFDVTDGFLLSSQAYTNKTRIEGRVDSLSKSTGTISVSLWDEAGNNLYQSAPIGLESSFKNELPKTDKPFYVAITIISKGTKVTLSNLAVN